jgi:hypothetical protein
MQQTGSNTIAFHKLKSLFDESAIIRYGFESQTLSGLTDIKYYLTFPIATY